MIRQRYKVSAAVLATVLLGAGLLASRPPDIPVPPAAGAARAEAAHLVDVGRCRSAPKELRFAWLKPGEEPLQPVNGPAAVCLAVYPIPAGGR